MPNPFDATKHEEAREERTADALARYMEMQMVGGMPEPKREEAK